MIETIENGFIEKTLPGLEVCIYSNLDLFSLDHHFLISIKPRLHKTLQLLKEDHNSSFSRVQILDVI